MLETVQELRRRKNVTVILITHYMEEVIDADRVYIMDSGHVVMQGTPRGNIQSGGRAENISFGCAAGDDACRKASKAGTGDSKGHSEKRRTGKSDCKFVETKKNR